VVGGFSRLDHPACLAAYRLLPRPDQFVLVFRPISLCSRAYRRDLVPLDALDLVSENAVPPRRRASEKAGDLSFGRAKGAVRGPRPTCGSAEGKGGVGDPCPTPIRGFILDSNGYSDTNDREEWSENTGNTDKARARHGACFSRLSLSLSTRIRAADRICLAVVAHISEAIGKG
jgi:hypothetical protein